MTTCVKCGLEAYEYRCAYVSFIHPEVVADLAYVPYEEVFKGEVRSDFVAKKFTDRLPHLDGGTKCMAEYGVYESVRFINGPRNLYETRICSAVQNTLLQNMLRRLACPGK